MNFTSFDAEKKRTIYKLMGSPIAGLPIFTNTKLLQRKCNPNKAMKEFYYLKNDYGLDTAQGKVFYSYHDCKRFWKYIRPVKRQTIS